MAAKRVGDVIKVRGETYRIVAIQGGGQGGKFFGKYRFFLQAADGSHFKAYGKTVAANSKLEKVSI